MAKTRKPRAAKPKKDQHPRLAEIRKQYPHVIEVVQTGKNDKPTRVKIACTAKYDDSCEETRECATQDMFQVTRCHSCQREYLKLRRRKGAAA